MTPLLRRCSKKEVGANCSLFLDVMNQVVYIKLKEKKEKSPIDFTKRFCPVLAMNCRSNPPEIKTTAGFFRSWISGGSLPFSSHSEAQANKELSTIQQFSAKPYIVQMEGKCLYESKKPGFVKATSAYFLEWANGPDLHECFKQRGNRPFPKEDLKKIIDAAVGSAIQLDNENLIHRDLKPENFLIFLKDGAIERVKLTDFGNVCKKDLPENEWKIHGTLSYWSPELMNVFILNKNDQRKLLDEKVDSWAIGILLYRILFGEKFPWFDQLDKIHVLMEERDACNPEKEKHKIARLNTEMVELAEDAQKEVGLFMKMPCPEPARIHRYMIWNLLRPHDQRWSRQQLFDFWQLQSPEVKKITGF